MKYFFVIFFFVSAYTYADSDKSQIFNSFTGPFKVKTVDFSNYLVAFSGIAKVSGEIIFEVVPDDGYENEIYKVAFIPDDPNVFPSIGSGFYPNALQKVSLLNHDKALMLIFTQEEWSKALSEKQPFISRRGIIEIVEYATSVECDSRQYYAKINSYKSTTSEVSFSQNRTELAGC